MRSAVAYSVPCKNTPGRGLGYDVNHIILVASAEGVWRRSLLARPWSWATASAHTREWCGARRAPPKCAQLLSYAQSPQNTPQIGALHRTAPSSNAPTLCCCAQKRATAARRLFCAPSAMYTARQLQHSLTASRRTCTLPSLEQSSLPCWHIHKGTPGKHEVFASSSAKTRLALFW